MDTSENSVQIIYTHCWNIGKYPLRHLSMYLRYPMKETSNIRKQMCTSLELFCHSYICTSFMQRNAISAPRTQNSDIIYQRNHGPVPSFVCGIDRLYIDLIHKTELSNNYFVTAICLAWKETYLSHGFCCHKSRQQQLELSPVRYDNNSLSCRALKCQLRSPVVNTRKSSNQSRWTAYCFRGTRGKARQS